MEPNNILYKLFSASRKTKRSIAIFMDMVWVLLSIWLAFFLRWDAFQFVDNRIVVFGFLSPLIAIPIFIHNDLYKVIIRYLSADIFWVVLRSVTLFCVIWAFVGFLFNIADITRSIVVINWVLLMFLLGGSRVLANWLVNFYLDIVYQVNSDEVISRVLVYGAGEAGIQLVSGLASYRHIKVIGFIDDNNLLYGQFILGIKVYRSTDLQSIVTKENISEILLAVPSASGDRRAEILTELGSLSVQVRTLPDIAAVVAGKIKVQDIREIDAADLLCRQSVSPESQLMRQTVENKVIMVTGCGGSIGSELCRQICLLNPRKILMYEINEFNLYMMDKEFSRRGVDFVSILGSVGDQEYLTNQCKLHNVDTVFHTAAYKHVPLLESNLLIAAKNNIFGTYSVAMAAINAKVNSFVLVSTDKAVRPTNVMGATKRFAEQILQALNVVSSQTKFVIVRFGNVIDSSGSVIPLFREQINTGGPVTVTDPEATRYFMTIPEASQLVIQAGAMGQGGEVYVLDMGEPIKIFDLATKMIRLSGLTLQDEDHPNGDILVKFSGLRPGEKLHEELLIGGEVAKTQHQRIRVANEEFLDWENMSTVLDDLRLCISNNDDIGVRKILRSVVEGYLSC